MYSWITLLASDNYIEGILALSHSLKLTNTIYPLIVLVTSTISEHTINILQKNNIQYIIINTLSFNQKNKNRWNITLNKFYIYNLTQYNKICFLDADIIIKHNIDYIFQFNTPCFLSPRYDSFKRYSIFKDNQLLNYPLRGGTFLITPSQKDFYNLLYLAETCDDDEELLEKFYKNKIYYFFDKNITQAIYHDVEDTKFWDRGYNYYNFVDLIKTNKIWITKFL